MAFTVLVWLQIDKDQYRDPTLTNQNTLVSKQRYLLQRTNFQIQFNNSNPSRFRQFYVINQF